MRNHDVAELLDKMAQASEAAGEDRFKVIAYRRGATSIRNLEEDVEDVWKRGELQEIKYVGDAIAKKVDEYLRTGRLEALEKMEKNVPTGTLELMKVPGIGPKTAFKLAKSYHVKSIEDLRVGLASGVLTEAVGQVMAKKLAEEVEKIKEGGSRMLLVEAFQLAAQLVSYFDEKGIEVHPAGSLRRGANTVGDIDLLTTDAKGADAFVSYPLVDRVIEQGPTKVSVFLKTGTQVDLRTVKGDELGAALIYFTGSKQHNIELRSLAIERGWKLNEYALAEAKSGRVIASKTEEAVYSKLGLAFIPPELREARGEVEAARERKLPNLVTVRDLRGDLQMHSTWSDGSAELERMARVAMESGYEYIAFTDHSVSVGIANGLNEERFRRQWKAIDDLNEKLKPFRILKAVEAEVRSDGSLDFERSFFDQFDIVGASIHQAYRQPPEKLTERAVKALEHPSVDILFHPTNRIIGRRQPNPLDLPKVIKTAKDNGKMLEIDGAPNRLDLDEVWARRAMQAGVRLVVDSDAHSPGELKNVQFGIAVARRAWLEAKDVANTLPLRDLLKLVS
ncbi:MAG TPA: DNA polymerase/3'-5' exonuclease PolX [Nitrososphaerales archaeon]|nr:DNA polymerase/3'-5' exonuclease PolX [Nitrososphaerales archaeon]